MGSSWNWLSSWVLSFLPRSSNPPLQVFPVRSMRCLMVYLSVVYASGYRFFLACLTYVSFPDSISLLEGSCFPVGRPLIYSLIYWRQCCRAPDIITLACVCWLVSLSSATLGRSTRLYYRVNLLSGRLICLLNSSFPFLLL